MQLSSLFIGSFNGSISISVLTFKTSLRVFLPAVNVPGTLAIV